MSIVASAAPVAPEPHENHASKTDSSIVNMIARRIVVPAALVLDVLTTLIRIAETTMQIVLPDVSAAFQVHQSPALALLYYTSNVLVILGISIGVTASLFLSMPLLYDISQRIDAAAKIRNQRQRRNMLEHLTAKRTRYARYVGLACFVPVLFGLSFFLAGFHIGVLEWVTAVADIAAPIVVLFVITQTEREAGAVEPQEIAVKTATAVVMDGLRAIRRTGDGLLSIAQAQTLKAGASGDIEGMIDAATPRDDDDVYYTVNEVCKKLNVSADHESADRKKVYRIASQAFKAGGDGIVQAPKGRGLLIPGKSYDKLYGDYQPVRSQPPKSA